MNTDQPPRISHVHNGPVSGFGSTEYIYALSGFGTPLQMPGSGGWYLRRGISGTSDFDGLGSYPFFVCQNWSELAADLDEAGRNLVSFAATPDPFGAHDLELLRKCFPDVCIHFKDHFVTDLAQPVDIYLSKQNRKRAEKALQHIQVEFCLAPLQYLEQWIVLFESAVRKFSITGIRAFSRESLTQQLKVPGMVMSLAKFQGKCVAIGLYCVANNIAYAHLVAAEESARQMGAFYALYLSGIHYFSDKVRWINWGGESGVTPGSGGLGSFKKGWATGTLPVYFCGRIFNRERYNEILRIKNQSGTPYFPAYRQGEFG